jgi:hypothetical protein
MENTQIAHFIGRQANNLNLWHKQFDHLGVSDLKLLTQRNFVNGSFFKVEEFFFWSRLHVGEVAQKVVSKERRNVN